MVAPVGEESVRVRVSLPSTQRVAVHLHMHLLGGLTPPPRR